MAKYRIVRYQRIVKDKHTGEIIKENSPVYNVEYKDILTILFGHGWDSLLYNDFKSYKEAEHALMEILNEKNEKEVLVKKVINKF